MTEIEATVDVIIQLVNGCGFPIVAFFALSMRLLPMP